jgi:hypothetical protein
VKPLKGFRVLIMRTSQTRLLGSAALRLMLPTVLTLAARGETSRRVCELRIILKGEARIGLSLRCGTSQRFHVAGAFHSFDGPFPLLTFTVISP